MANTTEFISAVFDELAKLLSINDSNPSIAMQMAWPGYALNPADFKPADAPNGPYDPDVAKEVFSQLANIAPLMSTARFENSGFEVDDLYEILIASAIPVGATAADLPANPINRLFSDAQFELTQAQRGFHDDPNRFYYPCVATPANWYDDAASQYWPTITLKQSDAKATPPAASPFARAGGLDLAKAGLWRLKTADASAVKSRAQDAATAKIALSRSILSKSPVAAPPIGLKQALGKNVAAASLSLGSKVPLAAEKTRTPAFVDSLGKARSAALFSRVAPPANTLQNRVAALSRVDLSKRDLGVPNLVDRLVLKDLLMQQLPATPASPATDGFSISFKFCRVNIDRPWLKLALLNNKNWWMFDTPAGEYSTGTADNNPGMFPLLTTSFIVIRDLAITANWSQEDRQNIGNAASFGFFDVRDGTLNQNTLTVKGMQIIAWISKVTPKLPPLPPP